MKRLPFVMALATTAVVVLSAAGSAAEDNNFRAVRPEVSDPFQTKLVNSVWLDGIGCPTNARVRLFSDQPPYNLLPESRYSDPACQPKVPLDPTSLTGGDPRDHNNQGLLMAKTGPTLNDASAEAQLLGVEGMVITELGYDIRKPGLTANGEPRGSHCGAGAPRFNVTLQQKDPVTGQNIVVFIGCSSPPATIQKAGIGFIRLRWGGSVDLMGYGPGGLQSLAGLRVKRIDLVFDEGQDPSGGPDQFGIAVLDNIDVNGHMIGCGSNTGNNRENSGNSGCGRSDNGDNGGGGGNN